MINQNTENCELFVKNIKEFMEQQKNTFINKEDVEHTFDTDKFRKETMLMNVSMMIASYFHKNQISRFNGEPYILHPIRIMNHFDDIESKCIALLHDTVEDTALTLKDLEEIFEDYLSIPFGVDLLTRKKDVSYDEYTDNMCTVNNVWIIPIKLKDLEDNSNILRVTPEFVNDGMSRIKRYHKTYYKLKKYYDHLIS